jgi:hypothetical protein
VFSVLVLSHEPITFIFITDENMEAFPTLIGRAQQANNSLSALEGIMSDALKPSFEFKVSPINVAVSKFQLIDVIVVVIVVWFIL